MTTAAAPKTFLTDEEMNTASGQTQGPTTPIAPPGFIPDDKASTFFDANSASPVQPPVSRFDQFSQGLAKGELDLVHSTSDIGKHILDFVNGGSNSLASIFNKKAQTPNFLKTENVIPEDVASQLDAKTNYEKAGKATELVGEYALGGLEKLGLGGAERATSYLADKLLSATTKKVLSKGTEYLADFGAGYGQAKLHGEDNTDAAISGVSIPVGNTLVKGAGKLLGKAVGAVQDFAKDAMTTKTPEFFDSKIKQTVGDYWNRAFPTSVSTMRNAANKGATPIEGLHNSASQAVAHMVENKNLLGLTDESGNPRLPQNRQEMYDAIGTMKSKVYNAYTDILKKNNPAPFIEGVTTDIKGMIHSLNHKLVVENSTDGQKAITTLIRELRGLRDVSPTGLQNYVERLRARSASVFNGGSPAALANESSAVASQMRDVISKNIENLKGDEYKNLRGLYGAYKTIESDAERAARNYVNKVGNKLFENTSNIVGGADTLIGLITHDPMAILRGVAIKGAEKANAYLKSPERNLSKIFSEVENIYNVAGKRIGDYGSPALRMGKKPPVTPEGAPEVVPGDQLEKNATMNTNEQYNNASAIPPSTTPDATVKTDTIPDVLPSEQTPVKTPENAGGDNQTDIFYHVTTPKNAKSIEVNGFEAKNGDMSSGLTTGKGTWMFKNNPELANKFGKSFIGNNAKTIESNVDGKIYQIPPDGERIHALAGDAKFISSLKKKGYVGMEGDELGNKSTFIFDPSSIKMKTPPTDNTNLKTALSAAPVIAAGVAGVATTDQKKEQKTYFPERINSVVEGDINKNAPNASNTVKDMVRDLQHNKKQHDVVFENPRQGNIDPELQKIIDALPYPNGNKKAVKGLINIESRSGSDDSGHIRDMGRYGWLVGATAGMVADAVKAGMSKKEIDFSTPEKAIATAAKLMDKTKGNMDLENDGFIWWEKNHNKGMTKGDPQKLLQTYYNLNSDHKSTENGDYPDASEKDIKDIQNKVYQAFPFTAQAHQTIDQAKIGILKPEEDSNSILFDKNKEMGTMTHKGATFHNFVVDHIAPFSKKASDFILNNTDFLQNMDKARIDIRTTDPTTLAHEMLHQVFDNSPMGNDSPYGEHFGTKFLETWDKVAQEDKDSPLSQIDDHIDSDYKTKEMSGSDLATERFAYLGEMVGKYGVEVIPKDLRSYYKQVFEFKNTKK